MSFVFLLLSLVAAAANGAIVLPTPGTNWTIGSDGRLQTGLVRWTSGKPATSTVEVTLRFGSSIGDVNIVARASPRFADANAIRNVLKAGQNFSEWDAAQFDLKTFDGKPIKSASADNVAVLLSSTTFLHVEVSCKVLQDGVGCAINEDFDVKPMSIKVAGGPCWFDNVCSARGSPLETRCATSGGVEYECVCATGYSSSTPNGKCVAASTVAPGNSTAGSSGSQTPPNGSSAGASSTVSAGSDSPQGASTTSAAAGTVAAPTLALLLLSQHFL